jgi:signal peptidase I
MLNKKRRFRKRPRPTLGRRVWEYAIGVALAVTIGLLIRGTVLGAYVIPSESMANTLAAGDRIMVSKLAYGLKAPFTDYTILNWGELKRGDVIVFRRPEEPVDLIKRVVGLAGDRVEIVSKTLIINGRPCPEPYTQFTNSDVLPESISPRDNLAPLIVPTGQLFVLGDNRDQSYDSRFWGCVDLNWVQGRAGLCMWSWNPENRHMRWSRLMTWIR